jgi:ribulose-5-phosphate 4-epimerase/fuculose-1-phosphate aldolase
MQSLIEKYVGKLVEQGVCKAEEPLMGSIDADLVWNKRTSENKVLERVIDGLNINSILLSKPSEPYASIINFLITNLNGCDVIYPQDCETRTFLHDIPVVDDLNSEMIITALKVRKAAIIPGYGIVTYGTVSPEQTFITFSSVCFACYVKFFTDYYRDIKNACNTKRQDEIYRNAIDIYSKFIKNFILPKLYNGPFESSERVMEAMVQAGKLVVDLRMVDSFFGNISYKYGDVVYISQTTSSLDELSGCIDPCPLDNSTCSALTASSELTAHKAMLCGEDDKLAVLHGHPKFSVILSMLCDDHESCELSDNCHIKCSKERFINDVPIVPGEVGTGKHGLCNTLPPAINGRRGTIVYGHGLFTLGKKDFVDAFENLLDIEKMCMNEYKQMVE